MSDYYQFRDDTGTPIDYYQLVDDNNNLCEEIERLNELVKGLREERDYLFNKTTTESNYEIKRLNNIINELNAELKRYKSIVWICEKVKDCDKE